MSKPQGSHSDRDCKKTFLRELSANIGEELCTLVDDGKIPDAWDGHELRCLLAERFEQSGAMSVIRSNKRCKRAKDYRNQCIIM